MEIKHAFLPLLPTCSYWNIPPDFCVRHVSSCSQVIISKFSTSLLTWGGNLSCVPISDWLQSRVLAVSNPGWRGGIVVVNSLCLCVILCAGWANISETKLAITNALTEARSKSLQQLLLSSAGNTSAALVWPSHTNFGKHWEQDTRRGERLAHFLRHRHAYKHKAG